jgi:hypothetical protein
MMCNYILNKYKMKMELESIGMEMYNLISITYNNNVRDIFIIIILDGDNKYCMDIYSVNNHRVKIDGVDDTCDV